jgi:hypothetical protein
VRKESTRGSHHRFDRIIRLSPRDGVTVSFVLFPVIGLVVTVIGGLVRRFNASVEASEPHDFAVRIGTLRPAHFRVHRSPRPTFVTIAKRPFLKGAGRGELVAVICPTAQGKWLRRIGTTGKSVGSFDRRVKDCCHSGAERSDELRCAIAHRRIYCAT